MIRDNTIRNIFLSAGFLITIMIPQWSVAACGEPATLISSIQGNGAESPLQGEVHSVEAVVTASFQGRNELRGFFIQEESDDQDNDIGSSEGLFVFHQDTLVEPGQLVRVSGEVQERFGQTQMSRVSEVVVCDSGALDKIHASNIRLPKVSETALEPYEGMLVRLKGKLIVTDNFNLGRFGEFVVSNKDRLLIPTQAVEPGMDAEALQSDNDLNRLIIDDASNIQNPDPIVYPDPELSWFNSLRVGQQVKPLTGVLAYAFSEYRIHPTRTVQFENKNPRPESPLGDDDHEDRLIIAGFNVLNYFNGDGLGGGFPTSRGADSETEFQRQSMKLGRAIGELGAAILGVVELENDGYSDDSAIASLTTTVNAYAYDTYQYINPDMEQLGNDAITVGLLYQPDKVTPVGEAMTLAEPPFDTLSRQPLAQVFRINDSDMEIMVIVNHFKSKSCGGASGDDVDQGDGQGCYNATRILSATKLAEWVKDVSVTPHQVILGDLNSYAQEDPVQALVGAGFYNKLNDEENYTFVFQGQSGVLDYALYSRSLRGMVKKVDAWHINADEPRVLDYNQEFKLERQWLTLYNDDPYRSSDHDPVYLILKTKMDDDD